jgi:hypothetical protein
VGLEEMVYRLVPVLYKLVVMDRGHCGCRWSSTAAVCVAFMLSFGRHRIAMASSARRQAFDAISTACCYFYEPVVGQFESWRASKPIEVRIWLAEESSLQPRAATAPSWMAKQYS